MQRALVEGAVAEEAERGAAGLLVQLAEAVVEPAHIVARLQRL